MSNDDIQPICVAPKIAGRMLGYGMTRVYQLLKTGELTSFSDGGARRITTKSISDYVERKLGDSSKPARHGPGRRKKAAA
jgi:hypothetical protein